MIHVAGMNYVCLYVSYSETLAPFSDEEIGKIVNAMLAYAATGENPRFDGNERFIWPTIKAQIDRDEAAYQERCEKNRLNGVKGGRPIKNQMVIPETEWFLEKPKKAKEKEKKKKNEKEKEKEKEKESDNAAESPSLHKCGTYNNVLLTDDDLLKLKSEFPADWDRRIEKLSAYMASTGKKYKNHLATVRNWAKREQEEVKNNGKADVPSIRIIDQSI